MRNTLVGEFRVHAMNCKIRGPPEDEMTRACMHRRSMMMPKQAGAILKQIPKDQNVQAEDDGDFPGEARRQNLAAGHEFVMMDQFEDLDGNEKCRFADGEPSRPRHAEDKSDAFHQRKKAVEK